MHKKLEDHFADNKDVVFLHLQTVWEGTHTNTPERGRHETKKYKINAAVGFDAHVDGGRTSIIMQRYGTGGTPWTIIIDKRGEVRVNEVTPGFDGLVKKIKRFRKGR